MILNASAANGSAGSACRSITTDSSPTAWPLTDGDVHRARQEVHDRVEHRLHALVLERAAAQHRGDRAGDGGPPDRRRRSCSSSGSVPSRYSSIISSSFSEMVSTIRSRHSRAASRWSCGIGDDVVGVALALGLPEQGPHPDQVDDAAEVGLDAPRQLDHQRGGAEPVRDHLDAAVELRADPVHLVHEADPRHAVPVGLPPHGLGLRLDAGHAVEHGHGAVEHPQRPLHLDGEVHVPGSVDQVDRVITPVAVVAAEVIVMPRSCSCAIQSMVAAPSWTSPIL